MQNKKLLHKIVGNAILFLIAGCFVSCHCDDKWCKGLDTRYAQWIPAINVGDSVRFVNGNGGRISFGVLQHDIPVDHIADCESRLLTGCHCEACVNNNVPGYISYQTGDTSRKIIDSAGYIFEYFIAMAAQIQKNDNDSMATLSYYIFDHHNTVTVDDANFLYASGDSLLPSFAIGPRIYSNVIVHQVDTTVNNPYYNYPPYDVFIIYKSWFNKEYGVVAFYDLVTQSLYYRE